MRAALAAIGLLLIIAGFALIVLPVVPGFPLVIVGMLMLAGSSVWIRSLLNGTERRLPGGIRHGLRKLLRRDRLQP